MIAAEEVALQRRLTTWFILADKDSVVLRRRSDVPDGAGGKTRSFVSLPAQVMRLLPQGSGTERKLEDGRIVESDHALLGEWDADMQRGDVFTMRGRSYEIIFVSQNTQYETKGEAIQVG